MSIEEAAQLVIQAGAMTRGGEVFILDMGHAVKIAELLEKDDRIIRMSIKTMITRMGILKLRFLA